MSQIMYSLSFHSCFKDKLENTKKSHLKKKKHNLTGVFMGPYSPTQAKLTSVCPKQGGVVTKEQKKAFFFLSG